MEPGAGISGTPAQTTAQLSNFECSLGATYASKMNEMTYILGMTPIG